MSKRKLNKDEQLLNWYIRYREVAKISYSRKVVRKPLHKDDMPKFTMETPAYNIDESYTRMYADKKVLKDKIEHCTDGRRLKTYLKELAKVDEKIDVYERIKKLCDIANNDTNNFNLLYSKAYEGREVPQNLYKLTEFNDIQQVSDLQFLESKNATLIADTFELEIFKHKLEHVLEFFEVDIAIFVKSRELQNTIFKVLSLAGFEDKHNPLYKPSSKEKILQWSEQCRAVDETAEYYFNINPSIQQYSKQKAKERVPDNRLRIISTLEFIIDYELQHSKNLAIKNPSTENHLLKAYILHDMFQDWISLKDARVITKYSKLSY